MGKKSVIEVLRGEMPYLASEYGVERIGVFGSHATGQATEASDVDVVVEFGRPIGFRFVEFAEHLEDLLGREVDVLTPEGIQAIRIGRVAQSIRESVVYV